MLICSIHKRIRVYFIFSTVPLYEFTVCVKIISLGRDCSVLMNIFVFFYCFNTYELLVFNPMWAGSIRGYSTTTPKCLCIIEIIK